jgi:dTDP-4-amino-4,6-dideoxygalactose transaminase
MRVEFYKHSLGEVDIQNTTDVLRSIFLTSGPVVSTFEEKFSKFTGMQHTVALNSCTAALHLALLACGIGTGDEVITTPMTFIATATAILHTGAKPVFVDVEADTGLIDPNRVEEAISSKTKAIIPVHLYGTMADMQALKRIGDRHGLFIIEDSAHCIEGSRDGIRPGDLSDAACFSFYATKNLTCGEGGALATNSKELAQIIRTLRQHGMSKEAADRYHGNYKHWDMIELGWKYNLNDIHAALLIDQLDRLDQYWERRNSIWALYDKGLQDVPGIRIPETRGKSGKHLYTIWVDPEKRDDFLHGLQDKAIGVAVNYRAIHTLTYFREAFGFKPLDFPAANLIGKSTVSIPFYPKLKDIEIDYVMVSIRQIVTTASSSFL